jgi:hypothetical protein
MSNQNSETSNQIVNNQRVTLLELLDRLLDKGVMAKGEILLSVADIDLVYLNLGLLLSSVKTVENAARRGGRREAGPALRQTSSQGEFSDELQAEAGRKDLAAPPLAKDNSQSRNDDGKIVARALPSAIDAVPNRSVQSKANIDQKNVEQGLAKLVLTLVELIRQLMEKQALRRVEDGQLNDQEIENMGNAFFLLAEKMEQLKEVFGLTDEDLNLDLGPLGELL